MPISPLLYPRLDAYLPSDYVAPKPLPVEKPSARRTFSSLSQDEQDAIDQDIAAQEKQDALYLRPRGAVGEIATGFQRGVFAGIPRMLGQALKSTGQPGDVWYEKGRALGKTANANEVEYAQDMNPETHGEAVRALAGYVENVGPSVAPMVAGLAMMPFTGGTSAIAAAGVMGAGAFGAAQYQDTYEKALKAGKTPAEAHALGLETGLYEGAGEGLGSVAGTKLLTGGGNILRRVLGTKHTVSDALAGVRNPNFLRSYAKDIATVAPVEVGTEMAQAASQAGAERREGVGTTTAWDAATGAIGPALTLTAVLGPFGALALKHTQKVNQALIRTVEDPTADAVTTNKAAAALEQQIAPLVGKEEARAWRLRSLDAAIMADAERAQIKESQREAEFRKEQDARLAEAEATAAAAKAAALARQVEQAQVADAKQRAYEDAHLQSNPPEGAMTFAEFTKRSQGKSSVEGPLQNSPETLPDVTYKGQQELDLGDPKRTKAEKKAGPATAQPPVKVTQEVLRSQYLAYLRSLQTPQEQPVATAGQQRLDLDNSEPFKEQPFALEPSPARTPVYAADQLVGTTRVPGEQITETADTAPPLDFPTTPDPNQGELDLMPVMNRPAGERPSPLNTNTPPRSQAEAVAQRTAMQDALERAGVRKGVQEGEAWAQRGDQTRYPPGTPRTDNVPITDVTRRVNVAAANKLADDALAGKINGNTPVAASDLLRVWEESAQAAGYDTAVLKGQSRGAVVQAINTAAKEKVWMRQLASLRKARDAMKTGTVKRATMNAFIYKLENFNGQAAPVSTERQGTTPSKREGKQEALLTPAADPLESKIVAEETTTSAPPPPPTAESKPPPVVTDLVPTIDGQSIADPAATADSTPPPVPTETVGSAPNTVVTSTGTERPVTYGELTTDTSTWDGTYGTRPIPRSPTATTTVGTRAALEARLERFGRPSGYKAEVPADMRRKTSKNKALADEDKLYTFEILLYNPDFALDAFVNSGWYTSWVQAHVDARAVNKEGKPTARAVNAKEALAWLDHFEGPDIGKRVIIARTESMFKLNGAAKETLRIHLKRITDQLEEEFAAIDAERRDNIARGMGAAAADELSIDQLRLLGQIVDSADEATARKQQKIIAENMRRGKQERKTKQQQAQDARRQQGSRFYDLFAEVIEGVANNDPAIMNLQAAAPTYARNEALAQAIERGNLNRVLEHLHREGPSEWVRQLAGKLRLLNLDSTISMVNKAPSTPGGTAFGGKRVYGRYVHLTNTIRIFLGGENAHTVLHEVVHAATVGKLAEGKKAAAKPWLLRTAQERQAAAAYQQVADFMREVKQRDRHNQYAFTNEAEFLAEAQSNEVFRRWLEVQEFGPLTGWQKFVAAVKALLGLHTITDYNALDKAMRLTVPFMEGSRFGAAANLSFDHSATGAMAAVDSGLTQLSTAWDTYASRYKLLGNAKSFMRKAGLELSSTFNLLRVAEKIPGLESFMPGLNRFSKTDDLKRNMRTEIQREASTVTGPLSAVFAARSNSDAINQKLQELAGFATVHNYDLRKDFDANLKRNPALNPALRAEAAKMRAEYNALDRKVREPFDRAFVFLRKGYVQYMANTISTVLGSYAGEQGKIVSPFIAALDIRRVTPLATNPNPEFYYDGYTAALDATVRKVFADLAQATKGEKSHLRADIQDLQKFYLAAIDTPYMHLGRSGEFMIEAKVADTPGAWERIGGIVGESGRVMGVANPERKLFMRFENEKERDLIHAKLMAAGADIQPGSMLRGSLYDSAMFDRMSGLPRVLRHFIHRIRDEFKGTGAEKEEMVRFMLRITTDMLPDSAPQNALKQRKEGGVAGYEGDFLRSLSKRTEGVASMVSTGYTMPLYDEAFKEMQDAVNAMRADPKANKVELAHAIMGEVGKRFSNSLDPVESPHIDAFKAFGFNMYLAFSPAFWLTNLMQPYHLTLPYLGARYGFVAAGKEMGKSSAKAFKLVKTAIENGWDAGKGAGGIRGALLGVLDLSLQLDNSGLTPEEVAFVRSLAESGQLDTTQGHEQGGIAAGEPQWKRTTMKALSAGSHYTEVVNRLTAGLAAYGLERKRNSKAGADMATLRAIDAVRATQFDYSDHNTARALGRHGRAGKLTPLFASFQQYSFQAMELLMRMARDVVNGEKYTDETGNVVDERKIAMKQLAGVFTTTGMLAGALGLPLVSVLTAVVDRVFGSDDEPYDVKVAFRQWLASVLGKRAAEVVARGVPRGMLGFDTSTRMGLADVLPGSRFLADRRELKDQLESGAFNLLGPAVSAATSFASGTSKVLNGQLMDGLIEALPIALKSPLKAGKMAEQGYTTETGNQLPMEVTPWAVTAQSFGFTPAVKAEQAEVNFAFRQRDALVKQRKMRLANEYYLAVEKGGDPTEVLERVMLFNSVNSQYAIDTAAGLKSRAKARAVADTTEGIATLPRYLPLLEKYSYANVR